MSKRKIYSLEDLYNLISKDKANYSFNSERTGYQLAVQVPAQFEVMKENNDDSLLFCKVKLMHSGENRNHSSVTDNALIKASKTLAYKPVLANFMEYTDEQSGETLKDFTSHDMELDDDNNIVYIEKQVGCFTSDDAFFEVEEETGHNFLYGYCAIPRDYTAAASIIERKGGTKISVELGINEMQYNASSNVLELTDVTITGATLLGKNSVTLNNVEEGMKNARVDLLDFSEENNSLFSSISEDEHSKLIETLDNINKTLSRLNINSKINPTVEKFEKGGNTKINMTKFEELLKIYNKTVEDITFEYEGLSAITSSIRVAISLLWSLQACLRFIELASLKLRPRILSNCFLRIVCVSSLEYFSYTLLLASIISELNSSMLSYLLSNCAKTLALKHVISFIYLILPSLTQYPCSEEPEYEQLCNMYLLKDCEPFQQNH